ncbi:MAG: hypothetical protein KF708_11225 [Pirellulales bacterium]|nr:hypothetical protein [Pirellulales bacterium]
MDSNPYSPPQSDLETKNRGPKWIELYRAAWLVLVTCWWISLAYDWWMIELDSYRFVLLSALAAIAAMPIIFGWFGKWPPDKPAENPLQFEDP